MPHIQVDHLSISFPLYHGSARSLKKTAGRLLSGRLAEDRNHRIIVQAVRDVSFTIKPGDRVGLLGHNGAGKTTLLRALAGIYEPIQGNIRIQGTLSSLLETTLGMNGELTGRENIRLRCLFNGFSAKRTAEIEENVQEFSELDSYLDMPLRTYSSGMTLRLGFGLATAINPQILMMDEWFMTGDAGFILKATARLEKLIQTAQILIISTHLPSVIATWCNRVFWMDQGYLKMQGTPQEILPIYLGKDCSDLFASGKT